ncbi:hypothetical protein ACRAVF_24060 [Bradyrhizobium oligotrophicum S58]
MFQLGHDSRLALNEFDYGQQGRANLELFSLLQGTLSFAAGAIARTGDMRVGLASASAKILGGFGGADIAELDGAVKLSIFHQDHGLSRATIYDQNGNPITSISGDDGKLTLTPDNSSHFNTDVQAKSDADRAFEIRNPQSRSCRSRRRRESSSTPEPSGRMARRLRPSATTTVAKAILPTRLSIMLRPQLSRTASCRVVETASLAIRPQTRLCRSGRPTTRR